jgi:probable H4MPT-linked C1 transfer pathway protein
MGWDIGGAHLKAIRLNSQGLIDFSRQEACPLWQGLNQLEHALNRIFAALPGDVPEHHAITMTGELADNFSSRSEGVMALTAAMKSRLGVGRVKVFAGNQPLIPAENLELEDAPKVASANWLASGLWAASCIKEAVFMDVGTTTTDILTISEHQACHRGYTDSERMGYDELVYSGVVRTPAMVLSRRAPLEGIWSGVMAELFSSTSDIYRLTGELPEHADQMPTADQGPKTREGSRQRLARQFGRDAESLPKSSLQSLAFYLRERQLMTLLDALELQLSRNLIGPSAHLIGAGVGRFLVKVLATRLQRPYMDFGDLFAGMSASTTDFQIADCGPAAAVACLAFRELDPPQ